MTLSIMEADAFTFVQWRYEKFLSAVEHKISDICDITEKNVTHRVQCNSSFPLKNRLNKQNKKETNI